MFRRSEAEGVGGIDRRSVGGEGLLAEGGGGSW